MRTKLAIAALGIALSAPAMAYNPKDDIMTCAEVADIGAQALAMKQERRSYISAASAFPRFNSIVSMAYEHEVDPQGQGFRMEVFYLCMDGGMEFVSGELVILD